MKGKQGMQLDIPEIPELLIDNTDRNRTSPFAFTGNRFDCVQLAPKQIALRHLLY